MWWVGTLVGVFLAGTRVTWLCADHSTATAPSMTLAEQLVPGVVSIAVLLLGLRCQGARWLPRMLLTIGVASLYAFVFFQVSHVQPETLDGDGIRAAVDDWGEFQLRTTKGWGATRGVLGCAPFLFHNLQPAHHLFPALHHSKLHLVTPLIRQHYPGGYDARGEYNVRCCLWRPVECDSTKRHPWIHTSVNAHALQLKLPTQARQSERTTDGLMNLKVAHQERGAVFTPCAARKGLVVHTRDGRHAALAIAYHGELEPRDPVVQRCGLHLAQPPTVEDEDLLAQGRVGTGLCMQGTGRHDDAFIMSHDREARAIVAPIEADGCIIDSKHHMTDVHSCHDLRHVHNLDCVLPRVVPHACSGLAMEPLPCSSEWRRVQRLPKLMLLRCAPS